jgi:hypothetical protein
VHSSVVADAAAGVGVITAYTTTSTIVVTIVVIVVVVDVVDVGLGGVCKRNAASQRCRCESHTALHTVAADDGVDSTSNTDTNKWYT